MSVKRMGRCLRRYAPSKETLGGSRLLQPVARYIGDPNVWHFNRRSIARGVALGLFLGFAIPMGFQIFLAALIAVSARANIAVAALFTSVSNPVTIVVLYPATVMTGDWLLGRDTNLLPANADVLHAIKDMPIPWFIGGIFLGTISATVGFLTIHFLWRFWVSWRWRARLARRRECA